MEVAEGRSAEDDFIKMNNKKISSSSAHFLLWYEYCKAYLLSARIGFRELSEQKYRNGFTLFDQDYIYEEKILLVPIIWSIKHAIELLLKEVDVRITNNFFRLTHNSDELRDRLKISLSSLGAKRSDFADRLSALSEKYLRLQFWGGIFDAAKWHCRCKERYISLSAKRRIPLSEK